MTRSDLPRVLAIAGPTASGKSALALRVAGALDAEIVNADALQVYAGLRVLTARPSDAELSAHVHHLFGHVDPSIRYSVGSWSRDALDIIEGVLARGKRVLLVGGTGLYFKALFEGLAEVPEPNPEAMAASAVLASEPGALHARALELDPVAASRVEPGDAQRLQRIVAVALGTERTLSEWQTDTRPLIADGAGVVVEGARENLYARIEARMDRMIADGALEEVRALTARGLDPDLPSMKAIGVAELSRADRGEASVEALGMEEAVELAKRNTRRFAKRQMTWFRNQTPDWPRVSRDAPLSDVTDAFRLAASQQRSRLDA